MGEPASRIEVLSLKLEYVKTVDHWINNDDPEDPFHINSNSCRIFINDGQRMREIHNPVKLKDFYTDLPPGFPQKRPRHSTISRPNTSAALPMYENLQEDYYYYYYSGGNKRKNADSSTSGGGGPIDLPLITDQYEDIRYYSSGFNLIVHQGTDDDLLKKKTKALYMTGFDARPEVYSYGSSREDLDFDKPTEVLDCIVFENSRVVTVSVTWLLMEEEEEDIGGKKNHDATTTKTTLICGGLYFRSSGCYDKKIVLLDTPDGKAVKVVHGKPIPLLRSVVAVPYDSTFTVEADLCDPNTTNNSVVQDTANFQTPAQDILHKPPHQLLRGNGLNFKVEVTVNNPRVEVFTYKFWE